MTCRVCVYDSSSNCKVGVGLLLDKAIVPPLPAGSLYMEEVHAKVRICSMCHTFMFLFLFVAQQKPTNVIKKFLLSFPCCVNVELIDHN